MSTMMRQRSSMHSHRQTRFDYVEVSQSFVESVIRQVTDGKSVILLGPRGVGKQRVVAEAEKRLNRNAEKRLNRNEDIIVRLRCDSPWCSRSEIGVISQIREQLPEITNAEIESIEKLGQILRRFLEEVPVRILFLVSNLDALPGAAARQLLIQFRELRALGQSGSGTFGLLITGSADLVPLVYGADSEFTPDQQYIIQGYDLNYFRQHAVSQSGTVLHEVDDGVMETLHRECGGSLLLLQVMLATLADYRRRSVTDLVSVITADELEMLRHQLSENQHVLTDILLPSFFRLEAALRSLGLLRVLLKDNSCMAPPDDEEPRGISVRNAPTELELCALARRQGEKLVWHSNLVRDLAKLYFTPRVLGDAFACNNAWDDAIHCYREAEVFRIPWVQTAGKRPRLRAVQRAFESRLHQIAGGDCSPVSELVKFFMEGARHMLGFDCAIRWRYDLANDTWQLKSHAISDRELSSVNENRVLSNLPDKASFQEGLIPVNEKSDAPFLILLGLSGKDGFPDEVIALSCLESRNPLTKIRREQIEPVANAFLEAYKRACWKESTSLRIEYQKHLLESLRDVFRMIGETPGRTQSALQKAGDTLRQNGYRRVMFCMVDQNTRTIRGVIDCRAEGEPNLAEITDYPVNLSETGSSAEWIDVQQECVETRKTLRIINAGDYPRVNPAARDLSKLEAFVLVPIVIKATGQVLGTMHVERNDRRPLSDIEITTLEYFAEQLAEAIDAASIVDFLEDGVQEHPDAMLLLNVSGEIVFANKHAAAMFSLRHEGWTLQGQKTDSRCVLPKAILEVMEIAVRQNHAVSRDVDLEGHGLHVVVAKPLEDWRKSRSGTLLQIQDVHKISDLWRSIRDFAGCVDRESLADRIMHALESRGHCWARLYLLDELDGLLTGFKQFGFEMGSAGARDFSNGKVILKSRVDSPVSWACIDKKKPIVFEQADDITVDESITIPTGLSVQRVRDSGCEYPYLVKPDKHRWIEVPLCSVEKQQVYGKLTIECPSGMTLDDLERLRIIAEGASAAFSAFAELDKRKRNYEEQHRRAMELAIERTCHQLQSKITSLNTLSRRYKYANTSDDRDLLNRDWDERQKKLQEILKATSLHLRPIVLNPSHVDLLNLVRSVVSQHFQPERFKVHSPLFKGHIRNRFKAYCDSGLIEEALDELINNSRKALPGESLCVDIELSERELPSRGDVLCRIVYRDNGPGIAEEVQGRLFEEFCSHWPGRSEEGTGLGLSLVQRIMRAHHGQIRNERSDSGACFVLEFPLSARTDEPENVPGAEEEGDDQ